MQRSALFGAVLATGLAFGCGSGGGGYPTSRNGSTGGGTTGGTTATASNVTIADFSFSPTPVTVKVGTTVTWTNYGGTAHTTTADAGAWDSGQIAAAVGGVYGMGGGSPGGTFTHTFGTVGTYTYHCSNHPTTMMGTVTVTP